MQVAETSILNGYVSSWERYLCVDNETHLRSMPYTRIVLHAFANKIETNLSPVQDIHYKGS